MNLKDIDGTTPGKAVLVSIEFGDTDVSRHTFDTFIGSDTCPDPELSARRLSASVRDDFPHREFKVIANPRARFLGWQTRMLDAHGLPASERDYLDMLA